MTRGRAKEELQIPKVGRRRWGVRFTDRVHHTDVWPQWAHGLVEGVKQDWKRVCPFEQS
jgi:hypothetical protein